MVLCIILKVEQFQSQLGSTSLKNLVIKQVNKKRDTEGSLFVHIKDGNYLRIFCSFSIFWWHSRELRILF